MLDQNTDRMWYVIGAVLIGAALIFGMNTFMPETFSGVGGMFDDFIGIVKHDPDGDTEEIYGDEEIDDLINKGYIPVATAGELNNVRSATLETYGKGTEWEDEYEGGLDKQYIQVADVDLSEYSGEGWNPIGDYSSRFRGTYDGGNYVITGLVVKGEGKDYQGLFGRTSGATISNVGLIDNKVTGRNYVGGLVGSDNDSTTISNSYATGPVTGSYSVGGLVGYGYGTISNSYATGSVIGGNSVGGLVGYAYNSSTISNSYATGSVTGTSNYAGGLVGSAGYTTISNSYATGSVKGANNVGGLVGWANDNSTIENSYWDTESTGQEESAGDGEGKSTDEMKKADTYSGWDFEETWKIDANDYPKLR